MCGQAGIWIGLKEFRLKEISWKVVAVAYQCLPSVNVLTGQCMRT